MFQSACSNYTYTSSVKSNTFKDEFLELISNYAGDLFDHGCLFAIESVDKIISQMELGKAATIDGLTA